MKTLRFGEMRIELEEKERKLALQAIFTRQQRPLQVTLHGSLPSRQLLAVELGGIDMLSRAGVGHAVIIQHNMAIIGRL